MPFANPEHALIAKQVIEVDAELNPSAVKRTLSVDGENLIAYVPSLRLLCFPIYLSDIPSLSLLNLSRVLSVLLGVVVRLFVRPRLTVSSTHRPSDSPD